MIFDRLGLPRDNGATDMLDSARLAGIMEVVQYPKSVNIWAYVDELGRFTRHPDYKNTKDFSRDQLVPLVAGMYAKRFQVTGNYVINTVDHDWWFAPNDDFLSPSVRNHIALCACDGRAGSLQVSRLGYFWLKLDILWNAYISPLDEPNQLICMIVRAGPEYVRMWLKHNKSWREAITTYWTGWRGENELAVRIIDFLNAYKENNNVES